MGRRQTIDRDHVLAVAEDIVAQRGAAALTIDAVAKAAGITKGGVQSSFGTKEALIAAMLRRWMQDYADRAGALAGGDPSLLARVAAHVEVTRRDDEDTQRRAASLLALLLQTPEHLVDLRQWYRDHAVGLHADDPAARRARLAFLATEGAFFLRFFGLMPIPATEWDATFADIQGLMTSQEAR
ncbi:TetR/AcrR family transcriptional regulator [Methylobacterium marchantiae]|uniref:TetR/AcrR family transcriptional regulator n=1 Tax=Methylobacterium marchantiae TaxID=600331 RepID=A0ABW3WWA0_9HYPH|nr:HTH-type transcriptional regulator BetI [Methylobacterium marchantiae]